MALMGGAALPAGQLAIIGNIAPQTASSHLSKLLHGKLLTVEDQGRHRYYRLASAEVAHAIEALLALGPGGRRAREGHGHASARQGAWPTRGAVTPILRGDSECEMHRLRLC